MKTKFYFGQLVAFRYFVVAALIIGFVSCEKTNIESQVTPSKLDGLGIRFEKDYLVFDDYKHFHNALQQIHKTPVKDVKQWQKKMGLVSKRTDIDQAILMMRRTSNALRSLNDNSIVESNVSFDGENFRLAFPFYDASMLLNRNGLVKVGKFYWLFLNDRVIQVTADRPFDLELAKTQSRTDKNNGIFVDKVMSAASQLRTSPNARVLGSTTIASRVLGITPNNPPYYRSYGYSENVYWSALSSVDGCSQIFYSFSFGVSSAYVENENLVFDNSTVWYVGMNHKSEANTSCSSVEYSVLGSYNFDGIYGTGGLLIQDLGTGIITHNTGPSNTFKWNRDIFCSIGAYLPYPGGNELIGVYGERSVAPWVSF